ncbi:MAG: type II toxin-antitoxin system death-on-curing family toxin [Acidobacteriota bacterium]
MAIEEAKYLSYVEAVYLHIILMRSWNEPLYGVADKTLIESALARPRQAVTYENADLIRQAATLYFGLIKNHPWFGGNKRTTTAVVDEFLYRNGKEITASKADVIELVLNIESDQYGVDEIEHWLQQRVTNLSQ